MDTLELEQAIRENPTNLQNYLVYGDVLQERGDPRGELMALQHARLLNPQDKRLRGAETAFIAEEQEALLGQLVENLDSLHLDWHMGFIRSARVFGGASLSKRRPLERVLEELFDHPSSVFLEELCLGSFRWRRQTELTAAELLEGFAERFSGLRSLFLFDDSVEREGDVGGLFGPDCRLEVLSVSGALGLGASIEAPGLRELHLHHAEEEDMQASLEALASSELAGMESLSLWCPDGTEADEIWPALVNKKLRTLRVWNLEDGLPIVDKLLASSQLEQLEILDMSGCGLDGSAARTLLRSRGKLENLRQLWLDGNHLGEGDREALAREYSNLRAEEQLPVDEVLPYWSDGEEPSLLACKALAMLPESPFAEEALAYLRVAPQGGRMLYNRASLMMLEGRYDEALPLARASVGLPDPVFIKMAYDNVAIAHGYRGDFDTAIEIARRSLLVYPNKANPFAILIDALRHQRRMEEALREVERGQGCVDGTPEGMALLQDCMLTYVVDGNPAAALRLYNAFLAEHGAPRGTLMACASIVHSHLGDRASAHKCLHRAEEANCRDPIVEHATACLFALQGKQKSARLALERARKAGYPEMHLCLHEDPLLSKL